MERNQIGNGIHKVCEINTWIKLEKDKIGKHEKTKKRLYR